MNYKKTLLLIGITMSILIASLIGYLITKNDAKANISSGESIIITSNKLNYDNGENGSFKLEKKVKWLDSDNAQIEYKLDTKAEIINNLEGNNVLFVLNLDSLDNLDKIKNDSIDLIKKIIENENNKVTIIVFNNENTIIKELTNEESLNDTINSIDNIVSVNYSKVLESVDSVISSYDKKEITMLMITNDNYRLEDNEIEEYKVFKEKYDYLNIQEIVYGDENYLDNIVNFKESFNTKVEDNKDTYSALEIIDILNTSDFEINEYKASFGNAKINNNELNWDLANLEVGSNASLLIDISLKKDVNTKELYSISTITKINTLINGIDDYVETEESPILKGIINVVYDGNLPDGCKTNIPNKVVVKPYQTVLKDKNILVCNDYTFDGWDIIGKIDDIDDDYFKVLEEDVTFKAKWLKEQNNNNNNKEIIINSDTEDYLITNEDINSTFGKDISRDKFELITFVDSLLIPNSVIEYWDVSLNNSKSIIAWYTDSDNNGLYELSISANGLVRVSNCSYLFSNFINVKEINLTNLDTSNVIDMSYMFDNCTSLEKITFDNNDVSNVLTMAYMFNNCTSLTTLDLSKLTVTKVTNIVEIFNNCQNLNYIDLSTFDTRNVTNMESAFSNCINLVTIKVSDLWITSSVTNSSNMFYHCYNLIGANGTRYSYNHTNKEYAQIDSVSNLGYLSK